MGDEMTFARCDGVSAERSGERVVVLDASGEVLRTLNPVGALVWERLPARRDEIVDDLASRFPDVQRTLLTADVDRFIEELRSRDLVRRIDAPD